MDQRSTAVAGFRPEVQALRTLAMAGVVFFHLWPKRLTGGYAGVDVFFVISGFLITSHLIREIKKTGSIKLGRFWARRIRRLLPASLLVIVFSLVGTILWAPQARWSAFFDEIIASSLYFQNWLLANNSVDYLAAENIASPVQHYWSLSLEEQYYLVFPILLILTLFIVRRFRLSQGNGLLVTVIGLGVLSFIYSVYFSYTSPSPAYFVTTTRLWEFACGGVLAILIEYGRLPRFGHPWLLSLCGWLTVATSYFILTANTVFPGFAAALPVVGVMLVIVGGSGSSRVLDEIVGFRPIQYLGDISYSAYLWHWPLIIFAGFVMGDLFWPEKSVIFVVTIVLAGLTKKFVEDPVRSAPWLTSGGFWRTAIAVLVPALIISGVGISGNALISANLASAEEKVSAELADANNCFGARAWFNDECSEYVPTSLVPAMASLEGDTSGAYSCYTFEETDELESCAFGSTSADAVRIALVGDSHAAMLIPALEEVATQEDWTIDTYVGRGCPWIAAEYIDPTNACSTRQTTMRDEILAGGYDYVFVTYRSLVDSSTDDVDALVEQYAGAWHEALSDGTQVIAITDNPALTDADYTCLTTSEVDALIEGGCALDEDVALGYPDAVALAAAGTDSGVALANTNELFCRDGVCPLSIGGVIVYRDTHHLTASYTKTMAPYLVDILKDAMNSLN